METHALSGIHLEINTGEYLSIAGPSGCGKSTLLSILGLLDTPTEGNYWLNGKAVESLDLSQRARIRNREVGFIFQSFNLIGDLTVFENVELPLTYRGMKSAERRARVNEALEKVGMAHRVKHLPSQLSGGQQQRVAVARALVGEPLILLADEPTGNLDSKNGEAVMNLLRDLHRGGATICMVNPRSPLRPLCESHRPSFRRARCRGSRGGWERRGRPQLAVSAFSDRLSGIRRQVSGAGFAMITLRNLEKFYPLGAGKYFVLRRINIDVKEEEFVTIMGPSGAGKSTLLSILGMLDGAWSGEYYFLDHPVHQLNAKKRAELNKQYIGFVFQQYHLLDNLTVAENLDIPLSYRNIKPTERQASVADVLDKFQMVAKKDLFPSQLSGGQQQLVAVARAVIAKPKLILADEPTGNLHSSQGKEIMELFKKLNDEGTTIVQVTHSETNAAYGNRVIKLADGWLVNE